MTHLTQTIVVLSLLLLAPLACSPRGNNKASSDAPLVRVRLLGGVQTCTIAGATAQSGSAASPMISFDNGRSTKRLGLPSGKGVVVALTKSGWTINGVAVGQGAGSVEMTIIPASPGDVTINGSAYRGSYRFVPAAEGKFDVVNDVDVDSYLLSVLPKELFRDWHVDAYKAQAVIARTYALYEVRTVSSGRGWDLHPDERSQVYGGMGVETAKATAAVNETRGIVAVYGPAGQERIFKAYFSSCCGGVSNGSGDVFNETPIPPLDARYNGSTCSISTRYNWGPITLSKAELTRRIRAWGAKQNRPEAKLPGVATIEIATNNQFGRPRRFLLTDTQGQPYSLTAEQMRWAINSDPQGGPTVFSGFFRPVDAGANIQLVDGHGFGHGVGACQWCMQAMALAGTPYEQIVMKNYPQATLERAY